MMLDLGVVRGRLEMLEFAIRQLNYRKGVVRTFPVNRFRSLDVLDIGDTDLYEAFFQDLHKLHQEVIGLGWRHLSLGKVDSLFRKVHSF